MKVPTVASMAAGLCQRPMTNDQRRFLPRDLYFCVRVRSAFHYDAAEFHDYHLRGERTRQSQLEHARIRIGQPVVLDHFFGDDVAGEDCCATAWSSGEA